MKEFNNILVVYDFEMGAEETIRRGVNLAARNNADLTILSVIENEYHSMDILSERRKILESLCTWIPVEDEKFRLIVKQGNITDEALSYIERFDIDLVITPTETAKAGGEHNGTYSTAEIHKRTDCPIWLVHSGSAQFYRTVLVAVNAGKENALDCPINKRLLKLGGSLAEMEMAELKVLYVWKHDQKINERLSGELPDEIRKTINEESHYKALAKLVKLVTHVLGEPMKAKLTVKLGDVEDRIMEFIEEISPDILISGDKTTSPLANPMMGKHDLGILDTAKCCVLIWRPYGIKK